MPDNHAAIRPEVLPLGQTGVLVRFSLAPAPQASGAVHRFRDIARSAPPAGITEIAPSLTSVLLRFDPEAITRHEVETWLRPLLDSEDWASARPPAPRRRWRIPAAFGEASGPGLADAARIAGMSEEEAVADITGTDLRVLAIGFAPGQPYLGLLPERWNIPRQPQLTPRVPVGAIVLAVRQLVLFAAENSTGWRQVGLSGFRPFQPASDTPFPLEPGDAVRLTQVPHSELEPMLAEGADPMGGARCEVLR